MNTCMYMIEMEDRRVTFYGLPAGIEEELSCLDYFDVVYTPSPPLTVGSHYTTTVFSFSPWECLDAVMSFPVVVQRILSDWLADRDD